MWVVYFCAAGVTDTQNIHGVGSFEMQEPSPAPAIDVRRTSSGAERDVPNAKESNVRTGRESKVDSAFPSETAVLTGNVLSF
jgi:hypothetical protein